MSFKKPQATTIPETFIPNVEELAKINEVRNLIGPAADRFTTECCDASILRFLRARNYSVRRASKMLKETLKWRLKYKPELIQWDDIAHEAKTGKLHRANYFDKYGRTVLIMRPANQNPNPVEDQIKCLVYCMESAIADLHQAQEQMVWLIDFQEWSMSSISVKVTRETARVLQDHYPDRLGAAIFYNPPKVFESFWLLVKPFLEPKTFKKVKFVYSDQPQSMKTMEALFDMDKLESAFGGKNTEEFEFEAYSKWMKDEEKRRSDAKNALPSDQTSVMSELQESDFLMSDVSFVASENDEADSSSNYGIGLDLDVLDEMSKVDEKLDLDRKIDDATKVEG